MKKPLHYQEKEKDAEREKWSLKGKTTKNRVTATKETRRLSDLGINEKSPLLDW